MGGGMEEGRKQASAAPPPGDAEVTVACHGRVGGDGGGAQQASAAPPPGDAKVTVTRHGRGGGWWSRDATGPSCPYPRRCKSHSNLSWEGGDRGGALQAPAAPPPGDAIVTITHQGRVMTGMGEKGQTTCVCKPRIQCFKEGKNWGFPRHERWIFE